MSARHAGVLRTPQLLVALLVGASSFAMAAPLSDRPERSFVTDGSVNTLVRDGDTIYIGGRFNRVGPRTGPGVEVALDGTPNFKLPEVSGAGPSLGGGGGMGVRAVVADGSGGWYIGGLFSHVGGVLRTNVAHILADASVDPDFNPAMNGAVNALAASGSALYVGGLFSSVDAQARNNIAAFDIADGSLTAFDPDTSKEVTALALSGNGSIVYMGGRGVTTVGGQTRTALAALSAIDGSVEDSFNPVLTGGQPAVTALVVDNSILYVGGNFDMVDGVDRRALAALSLGGADDGAVTAFDPQPNAASGCVPCATVSALALSGSTLYAGGSFNDLGGATRKNLAGLDLSTAAATAFNPNPNSGVQVLAATASTVYVGGGFTSIGGQSRTYIAALNPANGSADAFNPNPNNSVSALGVSDSAVYVGGLFGSLGGVTRNGLAAIDATDGTATAWNPAPEGLNGGSATIETLVVSDTAVYVGGTLTAVGGQPRTNLAAVNKIDGAATAWDPQPDGGISALALSGDLIYVGGTFLNIGGQWHIALAALSLEDGMATDWNPELDSSVWAIAISGDTVYVGGTFLHINGEPRTRLGAISAIDGSVTDWDPDLPISGSYIYTLAIADSLIYAGGGFDSVQGVPRHNIAAIRLADGSPNAFNPNPGDGTDDGAVATIAVDGDTVYAGGSFATIGGQPRNLLAALNASDGSATDFNPDGAGGLSVYALNLAADGTLYVGGSFPTFALAPQKSFAIFKPLVSDVIFRDGFE